VGYVLGSHLFNLFLARIARPGGVSNRCGDSYGVDLQRKDELIPRIFGM
jgi:hypothetical protein